MKAKEKGKAKACKPTKEKKMKYSYTGIKDIDKNIQRYKKAYKKNNISKKAGGKTKEKSAGSGDSQLNSDLQSSEQRLEPRVTHEP